MMRLQKYAHLKKTQSIRICIPQNRQCKIPIYKIPHFGGCKFKRNIFGRKVFEKIGDRGLKLEVLELSCFERNIFG
jgi:hypothetical protein